ncbi:hypothetical protein V8F33_010649 [Rhypophila sp. PSN 637]
MFLQSASSITFLIRFPWCSALSSDVVRINCPWYGRKSKEPPPHFASLHLVQYEEHLDHGIELCCLPAQFHLVHALNHNESTRDVVPYPTSSRSLTGWYLQCEMAGKEKLKQQWR